MSASSGDISDEIGLFGGGTLTTNDLGAVTLEPLLDLGRITEALGVGGRRQRLDRLVGDDMATVS
jgi:hypothetical protein